MAKELNYHFPYPDVIIVIIINLVIMDLIERRILKSTYFLLCVE